MKTRTDFVTNSSSSSFILAVREDLTEDILRKILSHKEYKEYFLGKWKSLFSTKYTISKFFNEIINPLKSNQNLGNCCGIWGKMNSYILYGGVASNDDETPDILKLLFYIPTIDSDYIKLIKEEYM